MAENVLKICRICLEQLEENELCHFLNNDNSLMLLSKLLDILPEIDLAFVQNPISCNQCTILINQIHEFKKLCMQTESVLKELTRQRKSVNNVISDVKNESEIVMIKEEILEEKCKDEYTINMAESVSKSCRICLEQLSESETLHFLNDDNGLMLLSKLLEFLPEIDLDFVQNPISCNPCTILIDRIHDFKKLCMQTESILKKLKQQRKSFNDVISYVKNECEIVMIKEDKFKNEPLIVDNDCLQDNTDLPVCIKVLTKVLFCCYTCDYTTYHKKSLTRHMNNHRLQVRQFKCNRCSYSTSNNSYLRAHQQSHRKIRPYQCNICSKSYFRKDKLKFHLKSHSEEKLYQCNVCDYRCNQKSHLKMHTLIHTGEKPYKCDVCDYPFSRKSDLKMHLYRHIGEKPYMCGVCDKSYIRKDHLTLHLKSHTGEKPYKCDVCDFSSAQKSNLTKHLRLHTGEKPYKCDVCNYSSAVKDHLKLHLRSHMRKTIKVECM